MSALARLIRTERRSEPRPSPEPRYINHDTNSFYRGREVVIVSELYIPTQGMTIATVRDCNMPSVTFAVRKHVLIPVEA